MGKTRTRVVLEDGWKLGGVSGALGIAIESLLDEIQAIWVLM